MVRIQEVFRSGKVFAAYLTAGDGTIEHQLTMIRALLSSGVNLIEIGIPFSDPIADGVVIARAMTRALYAGTTMDDVLRLIAAIRAESDVPIIVFTYYNPILSASDPVLPRIKQAGADGVLVVDLPFEEAAQHFDECIMHDLAPIAVLSPSSSMSRVREYIHYCQGFLYYACQQGTTGIRTALPSDLGSKISEIRLISDLPVLVGFGIADKQASNYALSVADGFVVGSYFVRAIEDGVSPDELAKLAADLNGECTIDCAPC